MYTPQCDVSVDESLMMWKGHLAWKVYVATKRANSGVKLFKLSEAESSYVWNFIFYVGKENVKDETYYGSNIVLEVMAPLLDQSYCATIDNWFLNPNLFEKLCNQNTNVIGRFIRTERGCLQKLKKKSRTKKLEYVSAYKDKRSVMKWKNKKDICFMNTTHDVAMIEKEF